MKKIIAFLLVAVMAISLVACGGNNDNPGKTDNPSQTQGGENNQGGTGTQSGTEGGEQDGTDSGTTSGVITKQTVMDNFGTNFEITISGQIGSTIIRDGNACLIKMAGVETLYYNGGEYFRSNPSAKFKLKQTMADFDINSITWGKTVLSTYLLSYYSGYDFAGQGWTNTKVTFLERPMTEYSFSGVTTVYIDDATGATFKNQSANYEVSAFSQGTASLADYIGAIESN